MTEPAASENLWNHPMAPWLVWVGLIAAFSPVLRELVDHLIEHPWARVSLVFPWLAWVAVREDQGRPGRASRPIIWTCMLLALLIEMIAISGDAIRFARIALAIGGAGMIAGAGWARLTASIVLAFSVPVPNAILRIGSPKFELLMAKPFAALIPGLELETSGRAVRWVTERGELLLDHPDTGLALGVGLAGLGWFQTVVTGGEWKDAIRRAVAWSLMMLPIQLSLLGIAGVCAGVFGRPGLGRVVLDEAGWLIVFGAGILLSLQALRGSAQFTSEPVSC